MLKGNRIERKHYNTLKAHLNKLSAKSNSKPKWADVLMARGVSVPTRADFFNGTTFRYLEMIMKNSDEQKIVNRQQGNTKVRRSLTIGFRRENVASRSGH